MGRKMKRGSLLAAALIAVVVIGANVLPSAAQQPPAPIATEVLTPRSVFTDDVDLKLKNKLDGRATEVVNVKDPSRTVVARITLQPGAQFPWHTHPGPVIVTVTQGQLTYYLYDDPECTPHLVSAGQGIVDDGRGLPSGVAPGVGVA